MLVVWDIDLTLLDNAGFGHAEAERLLAARGIARPEGLVFAGRTDADIWGTILGARPGDPALREFLNELSDACADAPWGGHVLPGVRDVVAALARAGHSQTVATGNMASTGWLKLRHAGLDEYMAPRFASFGDAVTDRRELLGATVSRWGGRGPVVAVGDTPADAAAALAHDVGFVGVATGRHGRAELTDAIRGAEGAAVIDDLRGAPDVVKLLENLAS
ncbi:HAD family hydrolase [uncultured Corynebacterium sp.]|uniref:HAD family hydrolase n=1 Tax=uncultured Corynebacterium sp. TaxID=159447 RepID=UPI0025FCF8BC|nr:HAD family hydrolase [uncultured Corynebacterium sp.]